MSDYTFASMMICGEPNFVENRYAISAYHGVWEPVSALPKSLYNCFFDDFGNESPDYFGAIQPKNPNVFDIADECNLFSCVRSVRYDQLYLTNTTPQSDFYEQEYEKFILVGWDVCCGNDWVSASCDGIFPIDPFTGFKKNEDWRLLNKFCLFDAVEHCLDYCRINYDNIEDSRPWYSVGVYLTRRSVSRLERR